MREDFLAEGGIVDNSFQQEAEAVEQEWHGMWCPGDASGGPDIITGGGRWSGVSVGGGRGRGY